MMSTLYFVQLGGPLKIAFPRKVPGMFRHFHPSHQVQRILCPEGHHVIFNYLICIQSLFWGTHFGTRSWMHSSLRCTSILGGDVVRNRLVALLCRKTYPHNICKGELIFRVFNLAPTLGWPSPSFSRHQPGRTTSSPGKSPFIKQKSAKGDKIFTANPRNYPSIIIGSRHLGVEMSLSPLSTGGRGVGDGRR